MSSNPVAAEADSADASTLSHANRVRSPRGGFAALSIGAMGIVFADIGTPPLYALDQIFFGRGGMRITPDNVLGGISLVIWALTIIVAIKYAILVLRAQNDGEGGLFALYGLLHRSAGRAMPLVLWALLLGAGFLFGDGIITPAISVLSAVEGAGVATPALRPWLVPVTALLLTAVFAVQSRGTAGIGRIFAPIVILWFFVIACLGAVQILHDPQILSAFNPAYGLRFLFRAGWFETLLILGALILVVTGGEAIYADVGHFGSAPIRTGWFTLVYPALLTNYLGQGAYLLSGAAVRDGKIFFSIVPASMIYPMVILATATTVIASQALISGTFSLASQAIRLGLLPRLKILHTHHTHAGQIYIPFVNWSLFIGCIILVAGFGSSSALAAAYGLAVSAVMTITSLAMVPVARLYWRWSRALTAAVWGTLTAVNGAFLLASCMKFLQGGFVPVTTGILLFLVMATWRWGRKATFAAYSAKHTMTVGELIRIHRECKVFMERTAVLMTPKPVRLQADRTPALLQLLWDRNGVLPRNLIFVEVTHRKVPYIHEDRYAVRVFEESRKRGTIISVELSFGFMEEPNVERALRDMARLKEIDLPDDKHQWIVHVSHENLLPAKNMTWLRSLRFRLFMFLRLLSQPAYYYYGLGDEVQLSTEILPVRMR